MYRLLRQLGGAVDSGGSRWRAGAGDERGIALVMALGFLVVLTIVGIALAGYTISNQQSNRYSSGREQARSLADDGLNNALSTLEAAVDPSDPNALASAASPSVGSGSGGTVYWWGSFNSASSTWTLTGEGVVPNPSAAGTITRTTSMNVSITYSPLWQYWYSDGGSGCTTLTNNVVLSPKLYVHGDLCIDKNVLINSSTVQVDGTLTMLNGSSVGQPAAPISQANIAGGCTRTSGGPYITPCTSAQKVYATTITATPGTVSQPAVDLNYWYQNARPGPMHNCTSGFVPGGFDSNSSLDRSLSTFMLTPATSYTCVYSGGGQLNWNAITKVLTISGAIFFDGNIYLTNGTYQGRGVIFSSGTISIDGNSKFCGVSTCDASWNPTSNLIVFVAGSSTDTYGFTISNNAIYQAATYVVDDYQQINNAANWGPVMARSIDVENNAPAPLPISSFPSGTPGAIVNIVQGSWSGN